MEVYKVGINKLSKTDGKVLIVIELIENKTDMTSFTDNVIKYKHALLSDFYLPYKINCGKVKRICCLNEHQELPNATIKSPIHGTINFETGKFFRMKYYDYGRNEFEDNYSFFVYKYKYGALNQSRYINPKTTGVRYYYLSNGRIEQKIYYKNGKTAHCYEYYNNEFNTMRASYIYSDLGVLQDEFHYDDYETLTKRITYTSDGTIYDTINYNPPTTIIKKKKRTRPGLSIGEEYNSEST